MHPDQPAVILKAARLRLATTSNVKDPSRWLAAVRAQIITDHADHIDDLLASGVTVDDVAVMIADTGSSRPAILSPTDLARSHELGERRCDLDPVAPARPVTRADALMAVRAIRARLRDAPVVSGARATLRG
jgi:hypothetical protein